MSGVWLLACALTAGDILAVGCVAWLLREGT